MARIGSARGALALLPLCAAVAVAAPTIEMESDVRRVGLDDTFQVQISVSEAPEGAELVLPQPKDAQVLGRSESTALSVGTGRTLQMTRSYTLTMKPLRVGKLTIPPAVLKSPTGTIKTESISLDVVAGRLAPAAPRAQPRGFPDPFQMFGGFGRQNDPFEQQPIGPNDVFLRATVDKTDVYPGEQITYTVSVYAAVEVTSVDGMKAPRLDGFTTADLKTPSPITSEPQVFRGRQYQVYLLRSRALFALRPGTYTIAPTELDIAAGGFFGGQKLSRTSNPLTLNVRQLPKGEDSTLVGKWTMSRTIASHQVAVGEPTQVTVKVEGQGNSLNIKVPPLNAPAPLKVYEAGAKDASTVRGSVLTSTRTAEYTVVPQQTGSFALPALRLAYFNPESGSWESTAVPAEQLTVVPAASAAPVAPSAVGGVAAASKNQLTAANPAPPRHAASFAAIGDQPIAPPLIWVAAGAPVALSLVALGFIAVRRRTPQASSAQRLRDARKAIANLRDPTLAPTEFYGQLESVVVAFLSAHAKRPLQGLTRPEIMTALTAAKVEPAACTRVHATLERCEVERFAPGLSSPAGRESLLNDALAVMEGLG